MAYKQKPELNEDAILEYLRDAVSRIRSEEDPVELNKYRRLFRRGVPFTLRSYFAAYVLKQLDGGSFPGTASRQGRRDRKERPARDERPAREGRDSRKGGRNESPAPKAERQERARGEEAKRDRQVEGKNRQAEPRQAESRPSLPDDVSTTLFVSVGRNRRVYPRDLIGLILQATGVERDHIGEIRVLDNYSFVQVMTDDAEKIIAELNETEYRGRKLTVSHSKKREDAPAGESQENGEGIGEEPSPSVAGDEAFGSDDPATDERYADDADLGAADESGDGASEGDPTGLADHEEDREEV